MHCIKSSATKMGCFDDLPPELLDLIARSLGLPEYLHLGATCRNLRLRFSHDILSARIKNIKGMKGDELNNWLRTFPLHKLHYISLCHVLSYIYRMNGLAFHLVKSHLEVLVERGASLKYVPCGDLVEQAAQRYDYEARLNWLMQHGASYGEVLGGINKLFREAFVRGDPKQKLEWMMSKGASRHALVDIPKDLSWQVPLSKESLRWRRNLLRQDTVKVANNPSLASLGYSLEQNPISLIARQNRMRYTPYLALRLDIRRAHSCEP